MSQYEQKPGTFTLFQFKKSENKNAPQYKGTINIEGKTFDISAWVKKDKSGNAYLSGQYKEPYKGNGQKEDLPF